MLNAEQLSLNEYLALNEYLGVSTLPINSPIIHAIEKLADTSDHEARGAIYTRFEVVGFQKMNRLN